MPGTTMTGEHLLRLKASMYAVFDKLEGSFPPVHSKLEVDPLKIDLEEESCILNFLNLDFTTSIWF